VLVVEDEESFGGPLPIGLKREGFLARWPTAAARI